MYILNTEKREIIDFLNIFKWTEKYNTVKMDWMEEFRQR